MGLCLTCAGDVGRIVPLRHRSTHRRADGGSNQSQVVNALEKQVYKWRLQLVENGENTMKKE